MKMEGFKV